LQVCINLKLNDILLPTEIKNSSYPVLQFIFLKLLSGVGNLQHACHTWHTKQFQMARRSYMFYISILLWSTQKIHWSLLV